MTTSRARLLVVDDDRVFRLSTAALLRDEGYDVETANDFTAEVRWADMESRSLSQVADALGKLSTMLGVPAQVLWDRIPGWTAQDTTKAKQLLDDGDALSRMMDEFSSQTGAAGGVAA